MSRRSSAALAVLMALAFGTAGAWEIGTGPRYHTVFETHSAFNGDVRVVEDAFTRYLLFDRSVQTGQDLKHPDRSALPYVDGFHLGRAAAPRSRSALFIGLGGGMGPRQFFDFYPAMKLDAVEIDPAVVEISQNYFGLPQSPRLRVFVGDGRAFLEKSLVRYDLIFLDAYDAHSAPPLLTTAEFMRLVRSRLEPGGTLVANAIAAREGARSRFGRSEYKTLKSVFSDVQVFPVQSALDPGAVPTVYENLMMVASTGRLPAKAEWVARAARLRRPEILGFSTIARHGPLDRWPTADVDVLTDAHPPREELFGK